MFESPSHFFIVDLSIDYTRKNICFLYKHHKMKYTMLTLLIVINIG